MLVQILIFSAALVLAASPAKAADGARKLLLFAKDPATWAIIKEGGSGRLDYDQNRGSYRLRAGGLRPLSAYALIRYLDRPPKGEVLARGTSDDQGRLELSGTWREWTGKFWVVSGEDVGGSPGRAASIKAWRPQRYLFEEKPLGIPCDCPETEAP